MGTTKSDHALCKAVNLLMLFQIGPVNPTRFVVLAVGIVVAALGPAKLISAQQHRHPARNQQGQQEVFNLALPDGLGMGIVRRPFKAVIVTEILVCPIAAVLPVGCIVLVSVTHEIVQSESVVACNEIDAGLRTLAGLRIDVGTPTDTAGEPTEHPVVATPETPDIISVPPVPLRPAPL